MELQDNLKQFKKNAIQPCAISYDPVNVLKSFAEKHRVTYPLLADTDSAVIRQFDIFNTLVPKGHRWYGVPFPGTFMVDEQGIVTDKSFYASHGVRDSVGRMLQEKFHITPEGCPTQTLETDDLKATASLTSGTVRRGQIQTFILNIEMKPGRHIYGPHLSGGYIPTTLTFQNIEDVRFGETVYPEPEPLTLKALNETLPVYEGCITLKATFLNRSRDNITVRARLDYQACDDRECYMPVQLDFELPIVYMDNA